MRVTIIKKDKIESQVLPAFVYGNYWIEDKDKNGNKRNLVNIDAVSGRWQIKSNYEVKIKLNGKEQENAVLTDYCFYTLDVVDENEITILYCSPVYDQSCQKVMINRNTDVTFGNDGNNNITFKSLNINPKQLKLSLSNTGSWSLENLNQNRIVFVNNYAFTGGKLNQGDVIFVMGLKIIIVGDNIIINNPNKLVTINPPLSVISNYAKYEEMPRIEVDKDEIEISLYNHKDFFFRAPRFVSANEDLEVRVDAPPIEPEPQEQPLLLTVGPMLTMALTSMVTGINSLTGVINGTKQLKDTWTQLLISVVMLCSTLLWPTISRRWQKKKQKEQNLLRRTKYTEYINQRKQVVLTKMATQKQIMVENILPPTQVMNIIKYRDRKLWERKLEHNDFLRLRLGIGDVASPVHISLPEEGAFTMSEDNLSDLFKKLGEDTKELKNVPISVSLTEKIVSAVIGNNNLTQKFANWLILQAITYHSYEDLKIVLFTTQDKEKEWEYLKEVPHCWSNNRDVRFFCTNPDDITQISKFVSQYFEYRKYPTGDTSKASTIDYKSVSPYFLIITDNFNGVKNSKIILDILSQDETNYGFSLLIIKDRLLGLPNECTTFINIDKTECGIIENELSKEKQNSFISDEIGDINLKEYANKLMNIPIEFANEIYTMPKTVTFLEMYGCGKVEQLNPLARWKKNDPIQSLQAPVGIDENGDIFKLDLHEKFHGPHGLIAGMTGSGKSEFIITYILSMAINYNPDEVTFVLIDYKGGGLTNAFENRKTGLKLPHLAGTITNLDENSINRALASIESELKRRQGIFNKSSEMLGESTIDIYKYQKLYREGRVKEPVPHLFIISDEFAELKVEQPDFMAQLISAARIGRALGVHLILATQKPAGIVNDQIWSNSKFRVCLKVQDATDSRDVIKRPDAADLVDVGRFFLQVGYNEFFAMGQSAWSGAPYQNTDKLKKKFDSAIDFITNIGYRFKSVDKELKDKKKLNYGDELSNIVKYLNDLALKNNIFCRKLWLDPLPSEIFVKKLERKYDWKKEKYIINPIIGEYDNPEKQVQGLLTMPLTKEGNALIYGSPGSGKENMLCTLIYSLIINYNTNQLNIYALDFGSETLKVFENAPQVGDIILSVEKEKTENLFKMLFLKIEERKKKFSEYGGDYVTYCKESGELLPVIILMVNGYDSFMEVYPEQENTILQYAREGFKYGLMLVMSTSGISSIRYKLDQNFGQKFVLQLNQENDYRSLISGVGKLLPSKIKGRGLIKLDDVYEFQSAYPLESSDMFGDIKKVCNLLCNKIKNKAEKIKILPDVVSYNFISDAISTVDKVPIGVGKFDLKVESFDFKSDVINLISSVDELNFKKFIKPLCKAINNTRNTNLIVVDTQKIINPIDLPNSNYFNKDFDDCVNKLHDYCKQLTVFVEKYMYNEESINACKDTVCVFVGFFEFFSKISDESGKKMSEIFSLSNKAKEKITFVIVDVSPNIKKFEFENWYRQSINQLNGIWIGSGLLDQYVIKVNKIERYMKEEISPNYGFVIKKGRPALVKLLNTEGEENNE